MHLCQCCRSATAANGPYCYGCDAGDPCPRCERLERDAEQDEIERERDVCAAIAELFVETER